MPLTFLSPGDEASVKKIKGRDDTCRFLESLGFVQGARVTLVSKMGDNVIVGVKGTRVALNKKITDRIDV